MLSAPRRATGRCGPRRKGEGLRTLRGPGDRGGGRVGADLGRVGGTRRRCVVGDSRGPSGRGWVFPMKGQIVHVVAEGRPDSAGWPIVQPILNFYLVPWSDGRIACGGTFEAEPASTPAPPRPGSGSVRECVSIAPGLATAAFAEVRVGLRPASTDERPLLGRLSGGSNVYVCIGPAGRGCCSGPTRALSSRRRYSVRNHLSSRRSTPVASASMRTRRKTRSERWSSRARVA